MDHLNDTALDVKKYIRLILKHKALVITTAMVVTTAVIVVAYLSPKKYEAQSMIFVERNFLNELLKEVTVSPSFEDKIKALSVVLKSRTLILRALGDIGIDQSTKTPEELDKFVRRVQENTSITIEVNQATRKDMDIFIVSYTDSKSARASEYLNTLVKRYIDENATSKRAQAFGANKFLAEQIASFKQKLARTEAELAAAMRKGKTGGGNEQALALEAKLRDLMMHYTENHPDVVKVKAELDAVMATTKKSAGAADELAAERSIPELERERDTKKKIYEDLLATLGRSEVSTEVEVQDKSGALRILDPAVVPRRPVSPDMLKMLFLGLLVGASSAVGVVVGRDLLDRSIKSAGMAKKLGLPLLAVIPTIRSDAEDQILRRRDRFLNLAAGLYLAAFLAAVTVEIMGLPYVDDFMQKTKSGITFLPDEQSPPRGERP